MNFQQLQFFVTAAGCRSFSLAAKKLYLSQPHLSRSVERLEQELGTRLFERSNKGVTLTREGQELFEHVAGIMEQLEELNSYYRRRKPSAPMIRLGTQPVGSIYAALTDISGGANATVKVLEGNRSQIIEAVASGTVEFGIIMTSTIDPIRFGDVYEQRGLTYRSMKKAPARVYFSNKLTLAGQTGIARGQLVGLCPILYNLDPFTEGQELRNAGVCALTNSMEFARGLLAAGGHYLIQTCWDRLLLEDEGITSAELDDAAVTTEIGYLCRQNTIVTEWQQELIRKLESQL